MPKEERKKRTRITFDDVDHKWKHHLGTLYCEFSELGAGQRDIVRVVGWTKSSLIVETVPTTVQGEGQYRTWAVDKTWLDLHPLTEPVHKTNRFTSTALISKRKTSEGGIAVRGHPGRMYLKCDDTKHGYCG